MTTTTTTASTVTTTAPVKPLVLPALVAVVGASVATAAVAGVGNLAGISLNVSGAPIPVPGFATLTAVFSLVGLLLALGLRRFARHPRTAFVRTTVALTALSLVPDVLADAATATKALLMLTHLVAAVIVIPAIARRLAA
ncbi:DUF6069 family protein [Umezawaea sp. NPDC059074]|uniref:DUF6069 family protein n=1 Tax=Umezawaea sp. NPDC059074 TaxID=3346716 RepID=UPI0036C38343